MELDYSVVIRTLGLAGEKYRKLLDSLEQQTVKPREILVVLAEGYDLPPEQLGYERFIYSKKGIVTQRSFGAKEAKGEYCLFLDDDLEFEPDTVEKLFRPIKDGIADVTFPLITEMLPRSKWGSIVSCLTAAAVPMLFRKKGVYVRILRSGGWCYNKQVEEDRINYYVAESAPGACFLVSRENAVNIRFEEECWLEKTSFSLPDDQVMFYKYHCLKYRIIGISHIRIVHLDAGSDSPGRALKTAYSLGKHKVIFWHRFILKNDERMASRFLSRICFGYWLVMTCLTGFAIALLKRDFAPYRQHVKGIVNGFSYLKTADYKSLPLVKSQNYKKNQSWM